MNKYIKKNITLSSIDTDYLLEKGYRIVFPKSPFVRVKLAGFLYRSLKVKHIPNLLKLTDNLSRNGFYKYFNSNFEIKVRYIKRFDQEKNKRQNIQIVNRHGKEVSTLKTTIFELSSKAVDAVIVAPQLSVSKALKIRSQHEIDVKAKRFIPDGIDDIEAVVKDIGHLIATGVFSLQEACSKYHVHLFDFVRWYYSYDFVKVIYQEAFDISKFVNGSTVISQATGLLLDMLKTGFVTSKDTIFDKVNIGIESVYVEKSKRERVEQIKPGDLVRVIEVFREQMQGLVTGVGEFDSMTDMELMDYIKENRELVK